MPHLSYLTVKRNKETSPIFERIQKIQGLKNMPVEEKLLVSGLNEEFEDCKVNNKTRAVHLLRWLDVEESAIKSLLK